MYIERGTVRISLGREGETITLAFKFKERAKARELYFDLDRGLLSGEISIKFSEPLNRTK